MEYYNELLVCGIVVIVSGAVVYLTSLFGIREKSYDEAIEEQRKRILNELTTKNAGGKGKKEKKKNKKLKVEKEASKSEQSEEEKVQESIPKHDHVEFEPDEIVINDTEEVSRNRKPSDGKPGKPILLNKEKNVEVLDVRVQERHRANSFDIVLPKDELALIKSKQNKKRVGSGSEKISSSVENARTEVVNDIGAAGDEIDGTLEKEKVVVVVPPESPVRRSKKTKSGQGGQATANIELSTKRVIDYVSNSSLTNEDVTVLINLLLNKQGDGSTDWTKKNDPALGLKKQLQEKEKALEAEIKNCQQAVARMKELRQELEIEKSKHLTLQNKINHLGLENQSMSSRMQQAGDQHRNEVKVLQGKLQQMQGKIAEERSQAMAFQRVQEENTRLQQALQAERSTSEALPHLKHEIEQLRAERQQFERRHTALQQTNEELHRNAQQMDETLKSLVNARQKDEYNYQQQIGEVKKQLQQVESEKTSVFEELQQACKKCNSIEGDNKCLKNRLDKVVEEHEGKKKNFENQLKELEEVLSDREKQLEKMQNGNSIEQEVEFKRMSTELLNLQNELDGVRKELDLEMKQKEFTQVQYDKERKSLVESERNYKEKFAEAERELKELEKYKTSAKEKMREINLVKGENEKIREYFVKEGFCESGDILEFVKEINSQLSNYRQKVSSEEEMKEKFARLEADLDGERGEKKRLSEEIEKHKRTLYETETMLRNLEQKIKEDVNEWEGKMNMKDREISELRKENEKLMGENKSFNEGIEQMQSLRGTISEMEEKLKELQVKLQGEENERKILENKYDEVNKANESLITEIDGKKKDMETLDVEREEIENYKKEIDDLKADLEKERKSCKEYQSQAVRMKSLVKIGEDSLKVEMLRVKELEEQLTIKNGSISKDQMNVNNSVENDSKE